MSRVQNVCGIEPMGPGEAARSDEKVRPLAGSGLAPSAERGQPTTADTIATLTTGEAYPFSSVKHSQTIAS